MEVGFGKSFHLTINLLNEVGFPSVGLRASFHRENEKRKLDPFTPAFRSKGEKARNRHKRN
ncbi:hypothetical protein [Pseudomonas serbica]|uniref:hypothetical protein n=1 Tax=Pseudomonas serbica TaxID=2965074 RepID=UPI00237C365A|nr:hypothetical protein [Pseudomonas serbica]